MKNKFNKFQLCLLLFAFLCAAFIYPAIFSFQFYTEQLAIIVLLTAFIIPFGIILTHHMPRMDKAITLIVLGAGFHAMYMGDMPLISIPNQLSMQYQVVGDMILFTCAGAGGGLIANLADTTTPEYQKKPERSTDKTKHYCSCTGAEKVVALEKRLEKMNKNMILSQAILTAFIGLLVLVVI